MSTWTVDILKWNLFNKMICCISTGYSSSSIVNLLIFWYICVVAVVAILLWEIGRGVEDPACKKSGWKYVKNKSNSLKFGYREYLPLPQKSSPMLDSRCYGCCSNTKYCSTFSKLIKMLEHIIPLSMAASQCDVRVTKRGISNQNKEKKR